MSGSRPIGAGVPARFNPEINQVKSSDNVGPSNKVTAHIDSVKKDRLLRAEGKVSLAQRDLSSFPIRGQKIMEDREAIEIDTRVGITMLASAAGIKEPALDRLISGNSEASVQTRMEQFFGTLEQFIGDNGPLGEDVRKLLEGLVKFRFGPQASIGALDKGTKMPKEIEMEKDAPQSEVNQTLTKHVGEAIGCLRGSLGKSFGSGVPATQRDFRAIQYIAAGIDLLENLSKMPKTNSGKILGDLSKLAGSGKLSSKQKELIESLSQQVKDDRLLSRQEGFLRNLSELAQANQESISDSVSKLSGLLKNTPKLAGNDDGLSLEQGRFLENLSKLVSNEEPLSNQAGIIENLSKLKPLLEKQTESFKNTPGSKLSLEQKELFESISKLNVLLEQAKLIGDISELNTSSEQAKELFGALSGPGKPLGDTKNLETMKDLRSGVFFMEFKLEPIDKKIREAIVSSLKSSGMDERQAERLGKVIDEELASGDRVSGLRGRNTTHKKQNAVYADREFPIASPIAGRCSDIDMSALELAGKWIPGMEGYVGDMQSRGAFSQNVRMATQTANFQVLPQSRVEILRDPKAFIERVAEKAKIAPGFVSEKIELAAEKVGSVAKVGVDISGLSIDNQKLRDDLLKIPFEDNQGTQRKLGDLVDGNNESLRSKKSLGSILKDTGLRTICSVSGTTTDIVVGLVALVGGDKMKEILGSLKEYVEAGCPPDSDKSQLSDDFKELFLAVSMYMQSGQYHSAGEVLGGLYTSALTLTGSDDKDFDKIAPKFEKMWEAFKARPEDFYPAIKAKQEGEYVDITKEELREIVGSVTSELQKEHRDNVNKRNEKGNVRVHREFQKHFQKQLEKNDNSPEELKKLTEIRNEHLRRTQDV